MIPVILILFGLAQNAAAQIEIVYVDHLTAGLIEQDVYVEKVPGTGMVYRVTPTEREKYLDFPVYGTAEPQKHDPFNARFSGPYKKGAAMDMTLREWLQGRGKATYTCEEGWGQLEASFENLVPNATYTMWYAFMAKHITDPFTGTLDLPIGDRDGTQSVFITDANGNGKLSIKFDNCLELSNRQLASMVAIAYHSDGNTYGSVSGEFGTVTHVQLFAILPDAETATKVGD